MRHIIFSVLLFWGSLVACSKKSDPVEPQQGSVPVITVSDITQARSNTVSSVFRFYLTLNAANSKPVSVDYTTVDGSAKANTDFTAKSGTLTIAANQSTPAFVDVEVKGDSLRQSDQQFYLQLSNPNNCTLGNSGKATATITNDGTYLPTDNSGYTTPTSYPGYTLTWSDEFSGSSIDQTNWNFESGAGGWGNNELEYYTGRPQNAFQSNGNLIIEARKENLGGSNYTSSRMQSYNKKSFMYGRIDIRAKLPVAKGLWPALWMLGSDISANPWPKCGEIDIMELVGTYPKRVVGSMHWPLANGTVGTLNSNYDLASEDFSQKFHVFSFIWEQNSMKFYVDDNLFFTGTSASVTNGTYVGNHPYFFIMNVAVGGDWPGSPDASTVFPQRMFVDYVRVFQK